MFLKIKPFDKKVWDLYENHGHFHEGDAGLDLYIIRKQTIKPYESTLIHLGISCENLENKPYMLMPRSSIAKTPLRLSNSIGLIDAGYRGEIMAAIDNIKNIVQLNDKYQKSIVTEEPRLVIPFFDHDGQLMSVSLLLLLWYLLLLWLV